jgi:hypothetical protein
VGALHPESSICVDFAKNQKGKRPKSFLRDGQDIRTAQALVESQQFGVEAVAPSKSVVCSPSTLSTESKEGSTPLKKAKSAKTAPSK